MTACKCHDMSLAAGGTPVSTRDVDSLKALWIIYNRDLCPYICHR